MFFSLWLQGVWHYPWVLRISQENMAGIFQASPGLLGCAIIKWTSVQVISGFFQIFVVEVNLLAIKYMYPINNSTPVTVCSFCFVPLHFLWMYVKHPFLYLDASSTWNDIISDQGKVRSKEPNYCCLSICILQKVYLSVS